METIEVSSSAHDQFVDITAQVQAVVKKSGVKSGVVTVFSAHTTAGLTINENADPDVTADILAGLESMVPWNAAWRHAEGNSAAHIKASMMGFSQTVFIEGGRLVLGTWQAIYLCEFDGPRTRKVHARVIAGT